MIDKSYFHSVFAFSVFEIVINLKILPDKSVTQIS